MKYFQYEGSEEAERNILKIEISTSKEIVLNNESEI